MQKFRISVLILVAFTLGTIAHAAISSAILDQRFLNAQGQAQKIEAGTATQQDRDELLIYLARRALILND